MLDNVWGTPSLVQNVVRSLVLGKVSMMIAVVVLAPVSLRPVAAYASRICAGE